LLFANCACLQKYTAGGWLRRAHSQNNSSLLPRSISCPLTAVPAVSRKRPGRSAAMFPFSSGKFIMSGIVMATLVAVSDCTRELFWFTAAMICSRVAFG
jgi:hypothetical protein